MDFGINRGKKKTYGVNAERSLTPGLTWAAYSDPETLWRESFQATACLFSLQSFPSVSADSRRLGEILAAEEAKEKPRRGAMPRGLAVGAEISHTQTKCGRAAAPHRGCPSHSLALCL